jgi:hypothetical protein
MKTLALLFIVTLAGCMNSHEKSPSVGVERKASVIYIGMPFEEAELLLKTYGAETYQDQSLMRAGTARQGYKSQKYHHPNKRADLEVVSKSEKGVRTIHGLLISTYIPKSWESKTDPEVAKYHDSFERRQEIDLEKEPNRPPQRNAGSRPSSGDSPASETLSSLGPRG